MAYVDRTADLAAACGVLRDCESVALDTEFMRERTYFARLCLVQLACDDQVFVVDPMAREMDLSPLLELLADPAVLKVVHAGVQDLEIFHTITGRVPSPVFDTQIAATLAGFPNQVGYAALVQGLLGVEVEKGERFTDWARRPLDARQLAYAEEDVRHLLPVWRELHRRLDEGGRLEWVEPDFEALTDPASYEALPEKQYLKVKKASSLNRRQMGVLREVAAWRELEARRRDVPRRRVLLDEALVEVARRAPRDAQSLLSLRGVEGRLSRSATDALLAAVEAGRAIPDDELPSMARRPALRSGEGVVELLTAHVRARSVEHDVAAPVLAPRGDIEAMAAGRVEGNPLMEGWRRRLIGQELLDLLEGRVALRVRDGLVEPFAPQAGAGTGASEG